MAKGTERSPTLTSIRRDTVSLPTVDVRVVRGADASAKPIATLRLGLDPLVVGTAPDCDVVVDDSSVSARHCSIQLTARGTRIRDLGSKNGTIVDGVEIVEAFLEHGSAVVVGEHRLLVSVEGAPATVELATAASFGEALGGSIVMRALFAKLGHAATSDETVLLLGESGTGKEVLARAIHDRSGRRDGPFVVLDCSAVAPNLLEATIFGHAKGAFTGAVQAAPGLFEQAQGGTLFIDEIGELPLDLQPKILRVLESRQYRRVGEVDLRSVDARFCAATHRDLRARVADRTFREDLYYRVAVVVAYLPPLRERKEDIPLIVERFLAAQSPPRYVDDLPPNALELLAAHDWPGNVRELRNTVARLVLFPHLLEEALDRGTGTASGDARASDGRPYHAFFDMPMHQARELLFEEFERAYLATNLERAGGNISKLAQKIGVSRQLVYRALERTGIKPKGT